jgi:hypothetical protein
MLQNLRSKIHVVLLASAVAGYLTSLHAQTFSCPSQTRFVLVPAPQQSYCQGTMVSYISQNNNNLRTGACVGTEITGEYIYSEPNCNQAPLEAFGSRWIRVVGGLDASGRCIRPSTKISDASDAACRIFPTLRASTKPRKPAPRPKPSACSVGPNTDGLKHRQPGTRAVNLSTSSIRDPKKINFNKTHISY